MTASPVLSRLFFMSITVGSGLASKVGVVVIFAHYFGVDGLGEYAYHFAIASFFGLISVFGFPIYLQRELSAKPDQFDVIHSEALSLKILLDGVLLALAMFLPLVVAVPNVELFYVFVLVRITMAYNLFFLVEFRVEGAFRTESILSATGNFLYFLFALIAASRFGSSLGVATGLLISQLAVLGAVVLVWYTTKRRQILAFTTIGILATFRKNLPYALDQGLTEFLSHITTFAVGLYLGNSALGIYQAGLRIANGVLTLASIVMGAFIAKMSECWSLGGNHFRVEATRSGAILATIGICAFLLFLFGGQYITSIFYPAGFSALNALWPFFGLYVATRYLAGVPGLLLVAAGFQKNRVKVNMIAASFVLLFLKLLLVTSDIRGLLGLLVASNIITGACYCWTVRKYSIMNGLTESV